MSDVRAPLEYSERSRWNHHVEKEFAKCIAVDHLYHRCKYLWAVLTVGPATADSPADFCKVSVPLLN